MKSLALQFDFVLKERLDAVEQRIANACARSGRSRNSITLIAVTKVFPASVIAEAYEHGLREFGENYVQEYAAKAPELPPMPQARFHLIGHLQSNKAKLAAELFDTVQTLDSEKLARRLDANASKPLDVMIEVKLSEEESKAGTAPDQVPGLITAIEACPNLRLLGFMTMPPWNEDAELSRPYFARLREVGSALPSASLSMGMSHDFEVAIEEGATHIRVGTALFGKRRKP